MRERLNRAGWVVLLAVCLLGVGCGGGPRPSPAAVGIQLVASGLSVPLDLEQPNDGSVRLFVVEQRGAIKILQNGTLLPQPFLDISNKVIFQGEMGLLGLTFHPGFQANGKFYVNYVRNAGGQFQSVIAEYQVSIANSNQANPSSERILLTVDQVNNFPNHKAGQLAFGPDGFLYFGLGDGGGEGDPLQHGQNTQILLGKMMRIDVNSAGANMPYAIPADNPFAAGGGLPEIYALGFRNPWRFSFDRASGRLFVADVGQDRFEEIDTAITDGTQWKAITALIRPAAAIWRD